MVAKPNFSSSLDIVAQHLQRQAPHTIWASFESKICELGISSVHYESGMRFNEKVEVCLKSERTDRSAFGNLVSKGFMRAAKEYPEFHKADSFVRHCAESVLPLVYDAAARSALPENMVGLNELAMDFGATGGLIIPLRGFNDPTFGNFTFIVDKQSPMRPQDLPVADLTAIAHFVHGALSAQTENPVRQPISYSPLSARERDCLSFVAAGLSTKRLSYKMGISDATANEHITNACRKLNARTRAEAAARAVHLGFVQL